MGVFKQEGNVLWSCSKHFHCEFCFLMNYCSAGCCFYPWSGSWTWSDELQNAFNYVSHKFWCSNCFLWRDKYQLDWCSLPNGRSSRRSPSAHLYGDIRKKKGTEVKSHIHHVLCQSLQVSKCSRMLKILLFEYSFLKFASWLWFCSAVCLLIPWIFLEKPKIDANASWNFPVLVLMLNSLCTFALNLSVFLVISHTSALTIRVAGVVKDWVVVLLSALLFADTKLTGINLLGYGIGKISDLLFISS